MKEKRYAVTVDFYIYARNDRESMVKAAQWAEKFRREEDNQARIIELHETPFASLMTREVHEGDLNIFENKLIEV